MAEEIDSHKKFSQITFNSKKYVFLQSECFWLFNTKVKSFD